MVLKVVFRNLPHLRQWCGQVPELPLLETKIAPKREVMCLAAWVLFTVAGNLASTEEPF
jgi:hypothetical protein